MEDRDLGNSGVAAFSRRGDLLAIGGDRDRLTLVDTTDWSTLHEFPPEGSDTIYSVAFSPDDRWLATGSDHNVIRIWEISTKAKTAEIRTHEDAVYSLAFSSDGRWLLSGGRDNSIRLWDMRRMKPAGEVGDPTAPVLAVAFSPDGRTIASGRQDASVRIYRRSKSLWGYRIE